MYQTKAAGHGRVRKDAVASDTTTGRAGRSLRSTLESLRPAPGTAPRRPVIRRNPTAERRSLGRGRQTSTMQYMRDVLGSTPGRFLIMIGVLMVLVVSLGWYSAVAVSTRSDTLADMNTTTEPAANASQVLYSSLSVADAAANTAFISGGIEPASLRGAYNSAIATASKSLVRAASGPQSDQAQADLDTIAELLPVYAATVETARTNNRLGNPVGSAYLGEASNLMRETILPAAQRLFDVRHEEISDKDNRYTRPPWTAYALATLTLAALGGSQLWLARRSRRRFNLGLLVASGLVVVSLLWMLVGGLLSTSSTRQAEIEGAQALRLLTTARIQTQQARSSETLALASRSDQRRDTAFARSTGAINTALTDSENAKHFSEVQPAVDRAIAALQTWRAAHDRVVERAAAGDYSAATTLTVGASPDGSAAAYGALDNALLDAIDSARTSYRDDIATARAVLAWAGGGVLGLALGACLAVVVGMYPRLREYR